MVIPLLAGCVVNANVATAINPNLEARPFDQIVVWVDFADLGLRREVEQRFVDRAAALSVGASLAPANLLFYPGRQYSGEEMAELLNASQAQAMLYVVATGVGSNQAWVPPIVTNAGGTPIVSGGYAVSSPWGSYSAHLIDLSEGETAWYATANLSGDAFTDHEDILARMVDEILIHAAADGFTPAPATVVAPRGSSSRPGPGGGPPR